MGDGCGEAGNLLGDTHTHRRREAVNCYETSLLGEHLWNAVVQRVGSVTAVQSKNKMEGGVVLTRDRWV